MPNNYESDDERRQAHFLSLFSTPFNPSLTQLCNEAIEAQTDMYLMPTGETLTLEQSFNAYIQPFLPQKQGNVDYKELFHNLSVGNMIIDKQIRKIEER